LRYKGAAAALVLAAGMFLLPRAGLGVRMLNSLAIANIFAVYALSFDVFSGTTLYLNLGHTFIIGIGAYTTALLWRMKGVKPYIGIPIAGLAAMAVGILVFLPSLRLRGAYFAIASLMYPIALYRISTVSPFSMILGGEGGIPVPHPLQSYLAELPAAEARRAFYTTSYYMSLLLLLASAAAAYKIAYSSFGVVLRGIGQDEELVEASGVNTLRYKLLAFMASSYIAGVAGALHVHILMAASPEILALDTTLIPILSIVVLGGLGTVIGPLGASYITILAYEYLWGVMGELRSIAFSLLLIALIVFKPEGLIYTLYAKARGALRR